jgi:hypothetical protein
VSDEPTPAELGRRLDEMERQTAAQWRKVDGLDREEIRPLRERVVVLEIQRDEIRRDLDGKDVDHAKRLGKLEAATRPANWSRIVREWVLVVAVLATGAGLVFYRREEGHALELRVTALEANNK